MVAIYVCSCALEKERMFAASRFSSTDTLSISRFCADTPHIFPFLFFFSSVLSFVLFLRGVSYTRVEYSFLSFLFLQSARCVRYPMLCLTPNIKRNIIIGRMILFPSIFRTICSPTGDRMILKLFFTTCS